MQNQVFSQNVNLGAELVKNEDLDETKGERTRLEEALRINQPLATAYYMKEEFRHFWEQPSVEEAARFLDDWCRRAEASTLSVTVNSTT